MQITNTEKMLAVLAALAAVFVAMSVVASLYQGTLTSLVREGGVAGVVAYIVLTTVFLVFMIPLDISVLIPVAAHAWGPFATALMSVTGWTIGSAIAFFIARRFGTTLAPRIVGARRLARAERAVPREHLFWWVLLLQAFITVDFISYVFGLFTSMGMGSYVLATGIGNLVPGFFFAYVGTLPLWYEVATFTLGVAVIAALFFHHSRRQKRRA